MNKKSSSGVPSEFPLLRGLSRVRYVGVRAIPRLVVYRLLSQLFQYRAIRCVWVDLEHWRQVSGKTVTFEIRSLNAEEIKRQAKLIGKDPEGVDQTIGAGVEAIGALRGGSIASYLWISPHPPALKDHFALEFDERLAYFYKAFTLPAFRGMGLMPAVLRAALESCASRGYRGAVACIDIANRPSWKAFRSAGFKTIATIRFAKIFGKHWIQPMCSQRRPRFRVQHVLTEKSGAAPPLSD
jgi:ribosomal protein S18 acetylase RimI-like enzyme